ncbi:MAG: heparinase [Planctomycetes bacterium]|nr:heparinase [Planctomycetota bacterium]
MQSLQWYLHRLRTMSAGEIAWRVHASLRDRADRLLLPLRQRPRPMAATWEPGFHVPEPSVVPQELPALLARADRLADNRLSFFDLDDQPLGDPIDWNRDFGNGVDAPRGFAGRIDYRDIRVAGDCKYVWEPSRHLQFVVLARAYRLSGQRRYAEAVVRQLVSWLDQCPYGTGMQWRSPLELAIRLINWTWALDLIAPTGLVTGDLRTRVLDAVQRHLWEISRKYSRYSSANNHTIGEAAGVYVAASYFRGLKGAARRRDEAREILCREILAQTYPDGGTREQATGYHLFVLQFFLLAGLVGRWTGDDFPEAYWRRLETMCDWLAALLGGGGVPMIGDADDGCVGDMGGDKLDPRQWLAVAAVVFNRGDFKPLAGNAVQAVGGLLGEAGREAFDALAVPGEAGPLVSTALADSGYYLLQNGRVGDGISVMFDCGPLGMDPLAAHGHADALSFTLRAFGADVLVDPGTYDYFTYRRWRDYFRSTSGHNTIVVDDENQSEMQGLFLWGRRAKAECLAWQAGPAGGVVSGRHDGYTRLADPVVHTRTLTLDGGVLRIDDTLEAAGEHRVRLPLHVAEHARVEQVDPAAWRIDVGPARVLVRMDPALQTHCLRGSEDPIGGWISRGYHRKAASCTIVGEARTAGPAAFTCTIHVERSTDDR